MTPKVQLFVSMAQSFISKGCIIDSTGTDTKMAFFDFSGPYCGRFSMMVEDIPDALHRVCVIFRKGNARTRMESTK